MSESQRAEFCASKVSYTTLHWALHRPFDYTGTVDEDDQVAIGNTHERLRHVTQNHYAKRRFVYLVGKRSEKSGTANAGR